MGNNDEAERRLSDAFARSPGTQVRKLYAAALLKSRRPRQAIEVLQPALKRAPNDYALLVLFAEAKRQTNEPALARKYFELAAKQKPGSADARAGLGLSRLAAGEIDWALADLEAAWNWAAKAWTSTWSGHFFR